MIELFITVLLALGIITSPTQATPEIIDQHRAEIEAYIIENDTDTM